MIEKYNFDFSAYLNNFANGFNVREHVSALVIIKLLNTLSECAVIAFMTNVIFVKDEFKLKPIFSSHIILFNWLCV